MGSMVQDIRILVSPSYVVVVVVVVVVEAPLWVVVVARLGTWDRWLLGSMWVGNDHPAILLCRRIAWSLVEEEPLWSAVVVEEEQL